MAGKFKDWIVTHIEGEGTDKKIVEELEKMEEEDVKVALEILSKLGYLEEREWENPFW